MSIPPLVCSSPPPLDQCEDDKDSEDLYSPYNLSQEDDDENYNYGNFPTFNCHKSPEKQKPPSPDTEASKPHEHLHNGIDDIELDTSETKPSEKQDTTEHLPHLTLDVHKETNDNNIEVDQIDVLKNETEISRLEISVIPSMSHEIIESENNCIRDVNTNLVSSPLDNDHIVEPPTTIDELIENESNDLTRRESDIVLDTETKPEKQSIEIEVLEYAANIGSDLRKDELFDITVNDEHTPAAVVDDKQHDNDDFGDFDDFQCATISNNNQSNILDNCDNPWNDNTEATNNDFGDFKATFTPQESEEKKQFSKTEEETIHSKEVDQIKDNLNEHDDFGEFDDFKSSGRENEGIVDSREQASQHTPISTLRNAESEDQIIERMNEVLYSIFPEEMPKPEYELQNDLEMKLGAVWAHVLEVDTRQPYIVKWNNSTGQKYLLKALRIDSRNILPVPRWSSSVPKFAANLTAAPLQPQKQAGSQPDAATQDKAAATKSTWSDPFTSDGQESGSVSTAANHPPIAIGPTDLDVFEASTSSEPDKIYSSTLNPQPLRHISLPDTHIFTPTDSETPRSKTIHYDNPTILLPSTTITSASLPEKDVSPVSGPAAGADIDNEYWEFQDFQGPTTSSISKVPQLAPEIDIQPSNPGCISLPVAEIMDPQPPISGCSSTSATFGTQVLQPIKVEPTMPTLNWPEPGEVKDTFDEFSDFISNSAWSGKESDIAPSKSEIVSDSPPFESDIPGAATTAHLDDEFDTFQAVLPINNVPSEFAFKSSGNVNATTEMFPAKTTTLDYSLPMNNQKSDVISFPSNSGPANVSVNSLLKNNDAKVDPSSVQPTGSLTPSVLKPMPATKSHKQAPNSGQILQPLSLESYSQINWPNPGIDLQDLSRFNPVETLTCLKSDLNTNTGSKGASPLHSHKVMNHQFDDDWGEFVSSTPKPQAFVDDDEWSDFVCSPSVKPQNGLTTISLNVHTNQNAQKSAHNSQFPTKTAQKPLDIPTLNYITPKTNKQKSYTDNQFQNL